MIFTLTMRKDFEIGDTDEDIPIAGKLTRVTWRDEFTLLFDGEPRAIVAWNEVYVVNGGDFIQFDYEEIQTAEDLFALLAATLRNQGERYKRPELLEPEDIETVYRAFEHRREEAEEVIRQLEQGKHD